MKRLILSALAASWMAAAGTAQAGDFVPAIVFDTGSKFDKSFNEAAYTGAERFRSETGIAYREVGVTNPSMREQAIRSMARRGASVVVAVGFAQAAAVEAVAKEFPDTKFTLIDMVVDLPNVQSIIFKEHEGSFLVGMAAAMATRTGKVGFIGGMDIPLIRKFGLGYVEGVRHVDPSIEIFRNMTGTTAAAWKDPTRGGELARSQFDRGADVIYAAAGATGIGVYQTAKDAGKLAIGVDMNQNYLHPGTMLTSMIKRVDVAVPERLRKRPQRNLEGRHPECSASPRTGSAGPSTSTTGHWSRPKWKPPSTRRRTTSSPAGSSSRTTRPGEAQPPGLGSGWWTNRDRGGARQVRDGPPAAGARGGGHRQAVRPGRGQRRRLHLGA